MNFAASGAHAGTARLWPKINREEPDAGATRARCSISAEKASPANKPSAGTTEAGRKSTGATARRSFPVSSLAAGM